MHLSPVENFIFKSPSPAKEIMDFLHNYFLSKGLKSKISYGLPFYIGKKWICYCNPQKSGGIELCFTHAHQFTDPTGLLQIRDRKRMKGIYLTSLESLPLDALEEIVAAAMEWDARNWEFTDVAIEFALQDALRGWIDDISPQAKYRLGSFIHNRLINRVL